MSSNNTSQSSSTANHEHFTPTTTQNVTQVSNIKAKDTGVVVWDGPNDPANPQNWPHRKRWQITALACILTLTVTFGSSAPSPALKDLGTEFNVSTEVTCLTLTLFLIGFASGPILWGPGSEVFGRRPVFLFSMACYILLQLGPALSRNIETFLITRLLSGIFAASPMSNSAGVIADIWGVVERGQATSLFTAAIYVGPVMGPIVGGFVVDSYLGWRWIFWIMMIIASVGYVLMALFLPETYSPVILKAKAKHLRKIDPINNGHKYAENETLDWTPAAFLRRTIYRPFYMLSKEPILVLITIYMSFMYGVMYGLFEALPIVFIEKRNFTRSQSGLIFLGVGIGTSLAAFIHLLLSRRYPRLVKEWKGYPPPEERLYGAMIAGPCMFVGSLWLGWTGNYPTIPWYVPAISLILIGMSVALIFVSFQAYLVDTYLSYTASALAANSIMRSAVAAAFPLFTDQMFHNLGVNWAATLLAIVALILAPSPFLFYKYGVSVRRRSTFAPCLDLHILDEREAEKNTSSV